MRKNKYLWMEVTADEYELPMCVERTAKNLADKLGMTEGEPTRWPFLILMGE